MDADQSPIAVEPPTLEQEPLEPMPVDDTAPVEAVTDTIPPPPPPSPPPAPPAASASRRWVVAAVLVALVSGGAAGAVAGRVTSKDTKTVIDAGPGGRISNPTDIHGVLAKVEPGVVSIKTEAYQAGPFFPSSGAGTGIVLTAGGEVLTNAHVVDGASSITVELPGETSARIADLVGIDTANDIALVRIRNASGLKTAELGASSSLRVGDSVVAIGNALGLKGGLTVTEGIVSALDRSIDTSSESLSGLIQTDAAINPGNSGGPLVDSAGRVIAMNTAVAGQAQNIGFAIAIDKVKPVLERLRRDHSGARQSTNPVAGGAFLGVSTQTGPDGAVVTNVSGGTPAAGAGIQVGDVLLAIDGQPVSGPTDLAAAIRKHQPGDKVTIRWRHAGTDQSTQVTLATRPSP
ncbi:MAG: trypsin-like serine protease with C-terminal domain [Acidimicrobiales bacterium]|nr:trypsin-like serine protease with C-terminal domain [Acidimicrobiales bacterium]